MVEVTLNTTDYPQLNSEEVFGLLPNWVRQYNVGLTEEETLKDHLDTAYGFGLYEFDGEILEDGTYRSPYEEDEDIKWIGKMNTLDGILYFYKYSIVGIPTQSGYFLTRMD